jgi:zinc finger protein 830
VEALGESSKRPRVNDAKAKGGPKGPKGLPEGFFSSGNRPAPVDDEEAEAVQGGVSAGPSTVSAPAAVSTTAVAGPPQPTGDDELDAFLFSIAQPEPEQTAPASTSTSEYSIVARGPRKGVPAYKELIPGQASYEAAPVKIVAGESAEEEEAEPEETEAEKRDRLAREEKEEIMGRLEEEERAQ